MNEWINVKDRLPDNYQYVLVCAIMEGTNEPCPISIGRWEIHWWKILFDQTEGEASACGDLSWWIDCAYITHWMPLPELPEMPQKSINEADLCDPMDNCEIKPGWPVK